jgi:hypothetical protein
MSLIRVPVALLGACLLSVANAGVNYEEEPINYSEATPENRVSRLQQRLGSGELTLEHRGPQGYLRAVLAALEIPVSSQVLTFAHTSLQDDKIGPRTPRAIYFSDDVHLGYVQGGLLEIAVSDPSLGMVFYTVSQDAEKPAAFQRRTNNCLTCHGAARTRNVPGVLVRSVHPDPDGHPVISAGSFVTTHASPLTQRWGGWYVTGTHGDQRHLGNFTLPDNKKPRQIDNAAGRNVTDLSGRFDVGEYLSPHSDLVALMVLEHQTATYNVLTQAGFEVRSALYEQEQGATVGAAELQPQIDKSAELVAKMLLFEGEARLTAPIRGTSEFAAEFAARGQRDSRGRSLREFDLARRMFRFPCSYLIQSDAFAGLPEPLRQAVFRRLRAALTRDQPATDDPLFTAEERLAVTEILSETVPGWSEAVRP